MNCKRYSALLTQAYEKTLCTRCGKAILRGEPMKPKSWPLGNIFDRFFGNKEGE